MTNGTTVVDGSSADLRDTSSSLNNGSDSVFLDFTRSYNLEWKSGMSNEYLVIKHSTVVRAWSWISGFLLDSALVANGDTSSGCDIRESREGVKSLRVWRTSLSSDDVFLISVPIIPSTFDLSIERR